MLACADNLQQLICKNLPLTQFKNKFVMLADVRNLCVTLELLFLLLKRLPLLAKGN